MSLYATSYSIVIMGGCEHWLYGWSYSDPNGQGFYKDCSRLFFQDNTFYTMPEDDGYVAYDRFLFQREFVFMVCPGLSDRGVKFLNYF